MKSEKLQKQLAKVSGKRKAKRRSMPPGEASVKSGVVRVKSAAAKRAKRRKRASLKAATPAPVAARKASARKVRYKAVSRRRKPCGCGRKIRKKSLKGGK